MHVAGSEASNRCNMVGWARGGEGWQLIMLTVPWYQESRHDCTSGESGEEKESGTMLHRERKSRKVFGVTDTKLLIMVISVGWDYRGCLLSMFRNSKLFEFLKIIFKF